MSLLERLAEASKARTLPAESSDHLRVRLLTDQSQSTRSVPKAPLARLEPPPLPFEPRNPHQQTTAVSDAQVGWDFVNPTASEQTTTAINNQLIAFRGDQQRQAEVAPEDQGDEACLASTKETLLALAGAISTLDAVESKLLIIESELRRIRLGGLKVDMSKVLKAFGRLADHTNAAVTSLDIQCTNLLRDARLEIRISELDREGQRSVGLELTMISVEKLLECKLSQSEEAGIDEIEVSHFVKELIQVVSSNIHVLSSILLTLCAKRDYTETMLTLLSREGIYTADDIAPDEAAPIRATRREAVDFDLSEDQADKSPQAQSASVVQDILQTVRDNRHNVFARFGNR